MTEPVVLINSFTAATRSPGMREAAAGPAGFPPPSVRGDRQARPDVMGSVSMNNTLTIHVVFTRR
jgi:hypothetical protein